MNDRTLSRPPMSGHTPSPTGAAMVVGGGIAGMQASLDLAEQGFKVYLVEKESAIGGKMAQLDKTFPTNDCAMCTISPKLVETGRHTNIEVLTNTEILDVEGEAGQFSVRVQQKPRYIDIEKCVACNDCTEVCPVIIPDLFNETLNDRRAAFKQYPQAVPNAYAIEKSGIAPCRDGCPAEQRAQGYIALIREGRWEDALRVIKMDNPFPGICGRICNHRCEDTCNREKVDEAINIRALKRFVTDKVYQKPRQPVEPVEIIHPDKPVAVIGAGPCGLTAAQDIIREGYPVTVFEALPVPGGMLRVGVPEYRLPAEIVEREVRDITDLGVDLRLNHQVDNFDEVFALGYKAVLIAVGAHEGVRPPIPGANQKGVLVSTTFLRDVRISQPPKLGERVVVVGAGDVAMDVARTAVRLGAEVHICYRRRREDASAGEQEIRHAQEEGVTFHFQTNLTEIVGNEGEFLEGVTCIETEPGIPDKSGRPRPVPIPESEYFFSCDTVIFAVGQRAGLAFIPDDAGVGITDQQTIAINPNTLAATREGVFAAGDSIFGTSFVIEAVASGHTVARSIIRYLQGKHLEPPRKPLLPVVDLSQKELEDRLARGEIKHQKRVPMPELAVENRVNSFEEVTRGYDEESAREEAARCLACGICSECMSCVFECGTDAIDHDMVAQEKNLDVGAIVLAPGYQIYQAELSQEFGFGRYPNVVTALQLERLLSASGPTMGHIQRPSDGKLPRRIAFLQCVGSRDQNHDYCSSVCCMYATKEAIMAKEHHPELDVHVFMMDMRAFSKGYLDYYKRAKDQYGIHYHYCRVSSLNENSHTQNLLLNYTTEENPNRQISEEFDLVVLSVGMEVSESVQSLGRQLGIELDEYGFCHTPQFNPVESSRAGIYAVGPFREPKDIPESVIEASSAAGSVGALLGANRHSLTTTLEFPPEDDFSGEEPRIGVFVCHCGSNIGGYLDVLKVAAYASTLPNVVHTEDNLYSCSQDSIQHITETVKEEKLNRVVVASCTPLTHQPLFQDSIRAAGLNPYLFEMANIRNHCSWVHSEEWDLATEKAQELVRMAVARAALLTAQPTIDVPVENAALVVGGGAAGMTASLTLAENGFPVHLVEKSAKLGGNLRNLYTSHEERDPQSLLRQLAEEVKESKKVTLYLESQVTGVSGFKGQFTSTVQGKNGEESQISHGAVILTTGAEEYRGPEYGYGSHPRILTQLEFEEMVANHQSTNPQFTGLPSSVVMIQCVGPGEEFCSRICCTAALKNALTLKEHKPGAKVIILYKDIRVYGFKERLYTQARKAGVLFIRYTDEHKPEVKIKEGDQKASGPALTVRARDPSLDRFIEIHPDLLVLSMPVVPNPDTRELANHFKVSTDRDGFFLEAHVKLRPVDFATEGIFMAGMAHYPKLIDESMVQAQAAAARASRILSQETLTAGGRVAVVDQSKCAGCLTCVRICPFDVPLIQSDQPGAGEILGTAYIETAICRGCGLCAAECPAHAIQLMHYTHEQMRAKAHALIKPDEILPLGELEHVTA
ncbi:MAG: NADPH-Fe(3+) oxidoreductase subunit beta [Chloroflexi bacterium]|nr:NADPH-Fe(3+) oxidoreductase subunit beta [Chloroflexota bacterium]